MKTVTHDLAVITVSTNESHYIRRLLPTLFSHMGDIRGEAVVVDNDSRDNVADVVAGFPDARIVWSANRGFGHANNRGLMTCNARYVLFLNPDTEILEGTFAELVALMDNRPSLGLVGCRQVSAEGRLDPTIRYFPNALRALGDALAAERLPLRRPRWLGEREVDLGAYERESFCDWTVGSFMLVRREALESAGCFDERFFMYSEETDLCRRVKSAGWQVQHLPQMTILHHEGKAGVKPHIESLGAVTRVMYARKHFSPVHRVLFFGVIVLRHLLRLLYTGNGDAAKLKRVASRHVLATLIGAREVPFTSITSPVSVQTGAAHLRSSRMRSDEERTQTSVTT